MSKKLELKFLNEDNKTVTFSLDTPIEPVDPTAVQFAMDEIINQGCFFSSGGELVSKKEARIVERTVTEITL